MTLYQKMIIQFQINMKKRRLKLDWTQKDLADKVGVSVPAISMIESGDRNPSLELAVKIGQALGAKVPLSLMEVKDNGKAEA